MSSGLHPKDILVDTFLTALCAIALLFALFPVPTVRAGLAVPASPVRRSSATFSTTRRAHIVELAENGYGYAVSLPLVSGRPEKYPADDRAYELEVLRLVNVERAVAGLPSLREDTALTQAARRHAEDMATHALASHTGSDGSTPAQRMREEGYLGTPWTEAANYNYPTPQEVVNGWMSSARHRDIILDRTSDQIGIGYNYNPGDGFRYSYVIDLGVAP
jgi:uncharacterized protein YkwD